MSKNKMVKDLVTGKMINIEDSFLYRHYKRAMDSGCKHYEYVIVNDLSDEQEIELKKWYKGLPK